MNFIVNNQREPNFSKNAGARHIRAGKRDNIAVIRHFENKAKNQLQCHNTVASAAGSSGPLSRSDIRIIGTGRNSLNISSRHSLSTREPVVYMVISVGRGHASGEVGIATIDINSPTLVLSQLSDDLWYSGLLTKINIYQPVEIIVTSSLLDAMPTHKMLSCIRGAFSNIRMVALDRHHFKDTDGMEMLQRLCAAKYKSVVLKMMKKYYALLSASALLQYVGYVARVEFAWGSLKVEYHAKYASMAIDVESAHRLELLFPLYPSAERRTCLLGVLDQCCTAVGRRHLRVRILQPSCDVSTIKAMHECIAELHHKKHMFNGLNLVIQGFQSVDQLNRIAYIVRQEENVRATETLINQALHLKSNLESIPPLLELLTDAENKTFGDMRQALQDPRYPYIAKQIHSIIDEDAHYSRSGSAQFFIRLNAVKTGINDYLDVNRQIHSKFLLHIHEIINESKAKHQLPLRFAHTLSRGFHIQLVIKKGTQITGIPSDFIVLSHSATNILLTTEPLQRINSQLTECIAEIQRTSFEIIAELLLRIRKEMDAIYNLTGIISELDITLSLAKVSIENETWCCPKFCDKMRITKAVHPFIEFGLFKSNIDPVPNNVIATSEFNFFIITGPNMSGKTMYMKMIALLQIMAQIGCYVPATSAEFRICDKLFTRMGFNDNIEQDASSFITEIREIEYIIKNMTANSLVLIDELCRSTSPSEGQLIAAKLCKRMLSMNGLAMNEQFYQSDDLVENVDTSVSSSASLANYRLGEITAPVIFFTTHFMELTHLADHFLNVINLCFKADIGPNSTKLICTHTLTVGCSPITFYGLALAETVRMPPFICPRAKEFCKHLMTTSNDLAISKRPYTTNPSTFNVSSPIASHSRHTNPINRTITQLDSNSMISSQSPIDMERLTYDLYANIVETLQNDAFNDNQATQHLNKLLQEFLINLPDIRDDMLNDSARFHEVVVLSPSTPPVKPSNPIAPVNDNNRHEECFTAEPVAALPVEPIVANNEGQEFQSAQPKITSADRQTNNVGLYSFISSETKAAVADTSPISLQSHHEALTIDPNVMATSNCTRDPVSEPALDASASFERSFDFSFHSTPGDFDLFMDTDAASPSYVRTDVTPPLPLLPFAIDDDYDDNDDDIFCGPVWPSGDFIFASPLNMIGPDMQVTQQTPTTPKRMPSLPSTVSVRPGDTISSVQSVNSTADSLLCYIRGGGMEMPVAFEAETTVSPPRPPLSKVCDKIKTI